MTEQWIPKDKDELMSAIEREWKHLLNVAERLTDVQMLTPDEGGWSPKDNLAHLSEWMNALMGYHLDRRPRHEVMRLPKEVVEAWDFEVINPALFERNRNRSRQDVLDELKKVYRELYYKLEAMSFDDLLKPRHDDDPEKRPVLMWVLGDTTEHFLEHRETIKGDKGLIIYVIARAFLFFARSNPLQQLEIALPPSSRARLAMTRALYQII